MNDNDVRGLLAGIDRPVEPPADVSERVRAAIAAELRQPVETQERPTTLDLGQMSEEGRSTRHREPQRPRWLAAAAIILLVAGIAAIALHGPTNPTNPSDQPVTTTNDNRTVPFLRACLDLRTAVQADGQPTNVFSEELDPTTPDGRRYLDELATALDDLARTPTGAPLEAQLRAAATEARSADPDLTTLTERLDTLAQETTELVGINCTGPVR